MKQAQTRGDWLTVQDMVRDLGGAVSDDKVRNWCRRKLIEGVINIGDGAKAHYRAPRKGWEKFLSVQRDVGSLAPRLTVRRLLSRPGTNHLGV
jgi:hypothetical protein